MRARGSRRAALVATASLLFGFASTAPSAQTVESFYRSHEIKLIVGFTTGGAAEIYARTIARHLPNHIPGQPRIILQLMPGAGSLTAANWLYNVAPRDGSVIGSIHSSVTLEPLYGFERARFDVKKFVWLGSMTTDFGVTLTWGSSQSRTIADARRRETIVGGLGPGAASDFVTVLLNDLVGTRFKLVSGYRGVNDIALAMERGELEGIGSWAWTALTSFKPDWIAEKKVNILVQQSLEPHPDLTARGIPFILDFIEKEGDRRVAELGLAFMGIGRPIVAPPGIPEDRAKALQAAFAQMLKDPAFLRDAADRKLEVVRPKTAAELGDLLGVVYASPKPIIERVLALQKKER